jgi:asparagine synthase (glutamine-hydrolysing)
MPGIVGIATKKPREWAEGCVADMVETIRHEPFYSTGTWSEPSLGIYAGWTARKGSFADGMPVRNERGDVTLVFSGEEFPEPDIACRLRQRGHSVADEGNAYLVHLYEEDPQYPAGLNGRFHGLVIDRTQKQALLFNDRYGMHRLYYHEAADAYYFASEAKAILRICPELRGVDPQGLGELISLGCVTGTRTVFQGIDLLPGGSVWKLGNGAVERKESYFRPSEWEGQAPMDPESYYRELRETFARNLPRYFKSAEPLGMSLTGGLDTRMIMAWHRAAPGELPCYTFGGTYRECRDVTVARKVAEVCRQPHQVIPTGGEFLSRFAHYAQRCVYLTDGCVDVSRSTALYVNERAREVAPVRMAGIYGSEILRRIRSFKPSTLAAGLFVPDILRDVNRADKTYRELRRRHPVSFVVFEQAPQRGVDKLEESQLSVRCPYLDNDLVRLAFRAPESEIVKSDAAANNDVCLRLIEDGNADLRRIRSDRGLAGEAGIAGAIARKCLELTFKAEYAYDYGMPHWVAEIDHLFAPLHLERLFLGRHKFYHFRVWYRDVLAGFVREMLLDPTTLARPYLERKQVETIVEGHLRGNRNYTTEIHTVMTLEFIHRLFVNRQ